MHFLHKRQDPLYDPCRQLNAARPLRKEETMPLPKSHHEESNPDQTLTRHPLYRLSYGGIACRAVNRTSSHRLSERPLLHSRSSTAVIQSKIELLRCRAMPCLSRRDGRNRTCYHLVPNQAPCHPAPSRGSCFLSHRLATQPYPGACEPVNSLACDVGHTLTAYPQQDSNLRSPTSEAGVFSSRP